MRKALPNCRGWNELVQAWHPRDLILVSRKVAHHRAQNPLFEHHREAFPDEDIPLLYRPKDTRKQNIMVMIPGPDAAKEELVLNNVVEVSVETAQEVLDGRWGKDWALGYAMMVHSTQGLTIEDPQKVWIVDDYLQWFNLSYLAMSRVWYLHQLAKCCPRQKQMARLHQPTTKHRLAKTWATSSSHPSALTPLGVWQTTCAWRMLQPSKRNKATGVLHATSSSSGAMGQRTHDSSALTGSTMQSAIHVTTCG